MVTTTKTTRGLIITICNYDLYQDPKNYETNNESGKKETRNEQQSGTIIEEGKEREEGEEEESTASGPTKRDPNKKITAGQFKTFWSIYPGKKSDKGKCLSKWKTICGWQTENPPSWNQIRNAIREQSESDRWKKGMIPLPHTWLNQRRWLDDPAEMNDYPRQSQKAKHGTLARGTTGRGKYDTKHKETEI